MFLLTFCYALTATSVMRELLIPAMSPTAINGHLEGDAYYYHQTAQAQVIAIENKGWAAFMLHPLGQGPAGIASALYMIWDSPYSVVVLNCLLHSLSVLMMVLLLTNWFDSRVAVLSALPLALSPYMMLWFSQVNKESMALTGSLLFVFGLVRLTRWQRAELLQSALTSFVIVLCGIVMIWVVRPYVNQMLLPFTALAVLVFTVLRIRQKQRGTALFASIGASVVLALFLFGTGAVSDKTLAQFDGYNLTRSQSEALQPFEPVDKCFRAIDLENWRDSMLLPDYANRKLKAFAGQRCNTLSLLNMQTGETTRSSFVDADFYPGSSIEMLGYLPRAFLLGIFSPWPDKWNSFLDGKPSVFYSLASFEAILAYLGIGGVALWLYRGGSRNILLPLSVAAVLMTLYAMATPFIGALYRYRYPWWMILICLGLACVMSTLSFFKFGNGVSGNSVQQNLQSANDHPATRGSGAEQ